MMVNTLISIDELQRRFGPAVNVAPYGECLVIHGVDFNPDWEAELGDLGYKCFLTNINERPVTLVKLKKAVPDGKAVYVPPTARAAASKILDIEAPNTKQTASHKSNAKADDFIVELWKANLTYEQIYKSVKEKLPEEHISVDYRILLLKNAGRIQSRHKINRGSTIKAANDPPATAAAPAVDAVNNEKSIEAPAEPPLEEPPEEAGPIEQTPDENVGISDLSDIVKKVQIISEAYESLSKAHVELEEDFEAYAKMQREISEAHREDLKILTEKYQQLQKKLANHKHAVSGEAAIPLEA